MRLDMGPGNWALATLMIVGFATEVNAADDLSCVDSGYALEAQQQLDSIVSTLSLKSYKSDGGPPSELLEIVGNRAYECAGARSWSIEALEFAGLYKVSELVRGAFEAQAGLSVSQLNNLQKEYYAADKAIVSRVLGLTLDEELAGKERRPASRTDHAYFMRLLERTGISPTKANADFIGAWWAAQDASETFARRFAAQ